LLKRPDDKQGGDKFLGKNGHAIKQDIILDLDFLRIFLIFLNNF